MRGMQNTQSHLFLRGFIAFVTIISGCSARPTDTSRDQRSENRVRSLLIEGDTAVEITDFAIQGTPKKEGAAFLFKGRAMVVY
ncbi:MAG: hypothetical protein WCE52_21890, partial [Candidatus Acidiferrum sp.]